MAVGSIRFSGETKMRQLADLLRERVRRFRDAPQSRRTVSFSLCRPGNATEAIACADEATCSAMPNLHWPTPGFFETLHRRGHTVMFPSYTSHATEPGSSAWTCTIPMPMADWTFV
jgi:hypothetical protein